ncbi:MAG: HDIG domain-containing protein [Lentisphaeria bacterium]|nr:HDIG domain-containing protein [Lentisphaeria bacterium]
MFRSVRDFWERITARRKLQRKGLVASRRRFDLDKLAEALEGSPAPGIFTLVMIWAISAVLLTISAQQHIEGVLNLVVGQQAPRTIIATMDFSYQDAEGTELEVRQAMEKVPLYFRIDAKSNNTIRRNFTMFFEAVGKRLSDEKAGRKYVSGGQLAEQLAASADPALAEAVGEFMRSTNEYKEFDSQLSRILGRGILNRTLRDSLKVSQTLRVIDQEQRRWPAKNVTEQDDPQAVADRLSFGVLRTYTGGGREKIGRELDALFLALIGPDGNLVADEKQYQEDRRRAADAVKPVMVAVSKGDLLVRRDQEVTPEISDKLKAFEHADRSNRKIDQEVAALIHNTVWSLVLVIFAAFYLYHLHPEVVRVNKRSMLLGFVVILSMLANFIGFHFFNSLANRSTDLPNGLVAEAIPVALGAVLLAVTMGYRVALCAGFFIASIAAMMLLPERSFDLAVKGMVICSLTALAVRSATNYRSYFIRILLSVFPLVWVLNLNLLNFHAPNFLVVLGQSAVVAFANAAATAILALILIFIFEIVFNVSTNMALMVLCDYNHPLMERMKREAPGTFFHSLMVATLVEDAARAIGANPLKAKAGALFHDIGKLSMPQYFTENNLDSANQHLDLNPQMSSIIIRDHVKEGLALARQHRMCRTVRDAISQHHGNDLVKFFYNKAVEEQKRTQNSSPVLESQFRYDGIPPQDREMAIISLADACEAACRSLDKPSASKIEAVVDDIFRGRFEGRQLNNANITLAELEKVRQSFINTLVSMKHGRIAYQQERKRDHNELRVANTPPSASAEK